MGFFRKKADPISERARALNEQIAALEAQIQQLSTAEPVEERPTSPRPASPPARPSQNDTRSSSHPRLRSTTLPHGHGGSTMNTPPPPAASPPEPVLEEVNPFRNGIDAPNPPPRPDLGVRSPDSITVWERIKNNFRSPPTSNPKLVNYLAAGSIQGLRPLRYEKRVARNRFLLLVVALALMLWGLVAAFLKR